MPDITFNMMTYPRTVIGDAQVVITAYFSGDVESYKPMRVFEEVVQLPNPDNYASVDSFIAQALRVIGSAVEQQMLKEGFIDIAAAMHGDHQRRPV